MFKQTGLLSTLFTFPSLVITVITTITMAIIITLLLASVPRLALAETPTTITLDGSNDFEGDESRPGTSGSVWYITWDATNLYVGLDASDVSSGTSDPDQKFVTLYLDTDPQSDPLTGAGSATGVTYNTQSPALPFRADYHFRWKVDDTYLNMLDWNSSTGSWTDDNTGDGNFGVAAAQSGTFVEFIIPRASLGDPEALYLAGSMVNEKADNEWTFFMLPQSNGPDGYDADFNNYLGFVLGNGLAPNQGVNLNCNPSPLVTVNSDSGPDTLRDSLTEVCEGGTVLIASGLATITLSTVDEVQFGPTYFPAITQTVTVDGQGAFIRRDTGAGQARFFHVTGPGDLTLRNLTLNLGLVTGGDGASGAGGAAGMGGAIFNQGHLTLDQAALFGNLAVGGYGITGGGGGGGGVAGPGNANGNGGDPNGGSNNDNGNGIPGGFGGGGGAGSDDGGAGGFGGGGGNGFIGGAGGFGGGGGGGDLGGSGGFGGGDGLISGGGGGGFGGAIFNHTGRVVITNSTLAGNIALGGSSSTEAGSGYGGAIFNYDGDLTLVNSTILTNGVSAGTGGGGSPNAAGGGIYSLSDTGLATVTLYNNIIAHTANGLTDCETGLTLRGRGSQVMVIANLIENNAGCGTATVTSNPLVGPLNYQPGETLYYPLTAASPAIDTGDNLTCPAVDQRGVSRPQDGDDDLMAVCDLGAYEVQNFNQTDLQLTKTAQATLVGLGHPVVYTLTYLNAGSVTATNVLITDSVPLTLTNFHFTSSGPLITDTGSATPYVWQVSDLPPGAGGIITLTGYVTSTLLAETSFVNQASIGSDLLDPLPDNNTDSVTVSVQIIIPDWVGAMFPTGDTLHSTARGQAFTVYVQAYKAGVTPGDAPGLSCEVQWSAVDEFGGPWLGLQRTPMAFNTTIDNNNEYVGTVTPPAPGKYEFTAICPGNVNGLEQGDGNGRLLVISSTTFVHLFEWRWADIADECETFLGPKGFGAVQVSPPMEHALVTTDLGGPVDYPWWQRYQPVSYALVSRSGTEAAFADMVSRCHAAGVDIYVDAVLNHMTGPTGLSGTDVVTGSGGSVYSYKNYPAVPYTAADFHTCTPPDIQAGDYDNNVHRVRTCQLVQLADLETEEASVQATLGTYLADLVGLGVDGFRLDAAKHITSSEISTILGSVLTATDTPYIFGEVIPDGTTSDGQYQMVGDVTEFEYSNQIAQKFRAGDLAVFNSNGVLFAYNWANFLPGYKAVIFTDNHDNQRDHGAGGDALTYRDGPLYLLGNVFMLAWPYGYPKVMSSYTIPPETTPHAGDVGPPADAEGNTTPVYVAGEAVCADFASPQVGQWVCEHRQTAIANMVGFRNATAGANTIGLWWDNGGDQITFARQVDGLSLGFVAINRSEIASLARVFLTGLPAGVYCDVISGEQAGNTCSGTVVVVGADGRAALSIPPLSAIAIHHQQILSGVTSTDVGVTKTVQPNPVIPGQALTYTLLITNVGAAVTSAQVIDTLPGEVTGVTWTCTASDATCGATSGGGNLADQVSLNDGGAITYTLSGVLAAGTDGVVVNTAQVTIASAILVDSYPANNQASVTSTPLDPNGPASVTLVGDFLDEISGCADWDAACAATHLDYMGNGVWRGQFTLPAGSWLYKVVLDDDWGAGSYPATNVSLTLSGPTSLRFYYDHKTRQVLDSENDPIAVVVGTFQSELGCPEISGGAGGDWEPACVRTLMTDPDDDGLYTYWDNRLPPGEHAMKVARDESWAVAHPGLNLEFEMMWAGEPVGFTWDSLNPASVAATPAEMRALWLNAETIAWNAFGGETYRLHYDPNGDLALAYSPTGTLHLRGTDNLSLTLTFSQTLSGAPSPTYPKFPQVEGYDAWRVAASDLSAVPDILRGQFALAAYDAAGNLLTVSGVQIQGVLDDLYTTSDGLGLSYAAGVPSLSLWAPTARAVTLHRYPDAISSTASITAPLSLMSSGVWGITGESSWDRQYYVYEVAVYAPTVGEVVHHWVTDPYAVSLSVNYLQAGTPGNAQRSQFVDLFNDTSLMPSGWAGLSKPAFNAPEDAAIYELHVRDFSINDPTVNPIDRGTYRAFTYNGTDRPLSQGMAHLLALAGAGLTHLHLLPVADSGTMVEDAAERLQPPDLSGYGPADEDQQYQISLIRTRDGFNWGYETQHFAAPEGAYATDPDGPARILEFREMVQSLNQHGLRLVMDVVYNHTYRAGLASGAVLDKIVPGYYQRLDAAGRVETQSCCPDTAAEFAMMEKLMVDTVVLWAKAYKVDGFRFDLMNFHTVANMETVREAVQGLTLAEDGVVGAKIYLYGEGWDFGGAKDKGFVHANQLNMAGTGIGTFNDRIRDAIHGGFNTDDLIIRTQGFVNGLAYDWNGYEYPNRFEGDLFYQTDRLRVGLAGNLQNYTFIDQNGDPQTGLGLNGTGYALDPQEAVHYASKHDNETLYDLNAFKLPLGESGTGVTTMAERVRVQNMALSLIGLSQGVPFFHAGSDMLRSKSLDRNSYDSGDWFNRLDFSYQSNNFGVGLPPYWDNESRWDIMTPLLLNPALYPTPDDITVNAAHLRDILAIRRSSKLFRLETEAEVLARLHFHNTGPDQIPGLIALTISDTVGIDLDPAAEHLVLLFNASLTTQTVTLPALAGRYVVLHPVLTAALDPVVGQASYNGATGAFSVPPRTTAVFIDQEPTPLTAVTIVGPTNWGVGSQATFTAQVNPLTATLPLTYTWTPVPDSGQGTAAAIYSWNTPGPQVITVTVENPLNLVTDTHTVTISEVPLTSLSITGPVTGLVNIPITFISSYTPLSASTPISYTWLPAPENGQGTASVTYTWGITGPQQITLLAENGGSALTATHWITITAPVVVEPDVPLSAVSIAGPGSGLVNTALSFAASVSPPTATTPITYTWTPAPDSGQGTADVSYTWGITGPQTITVTAENAVSVVMASHTITVVGLSEATPLSGVSISGPVTATMNTSSDFTATINPPEATGPFVYAWTPPPASGQGTASVSYTWGITGSQAISLTVSGPLNAVSATHTITVTAPVVVEPDVPLSAVSISGPISGLVNTSLSFAASVSPPTATTPITYTWTPAPDSGQGTADVSYTWGITGPQTITVTAENAVSVVMASHTITVVGLSEATPLSGVSISGPATGTPNTSYTFSGAIAPLTATAPYTYTWVPAPDGGQGTAEAMYSWGVAGVYTLSLTAANPVSVVSTSHTITVATGETGYQLYLPLVLK